MLLIHLHFRGAPKGCPGRCWVKALGYSVGVKGAESPRGDTRVARWYRSRDKAVHGVPLANLGTFLLSLPWSFSPRPSAEDTSLD